MATQTPQVSSTLAEKDELKSSLVEHTSSSHFEDEVVSLREQVSRLSEALSQVSVCVCVWCVWRVCGHLSYV